MADDQARNTTNGARGQPCQTTLQARKPDQQSHNSARMVEESYPNPSIRASSDGKSAVTEQRFLAPPPPLPSTEGARSSSPTKWKRTDGPDTVQTNDARNAWGDSRFAEESKMMKAHAESLLAAGVISASQAVRLSVPWHEKGVVDGSIWEDEYLDPSKKVTEYEIMPYEKARKARHRMDRAQRKWLERWEAGRINDEGNAIVQAESSKTGSGNTAATQSDGDVESVEVVESRVATYRSGGAGNISGQYYGVVGKSRPDTPRKIKSTTETKNKEKTQDLETILEESSSTETSALGAPSSTNSSSPDNVVEASSSFASRRPPIRVAPKPPAEASTQVQAGSSFMTWNLQAQSTSVSMYRNLDYGELLRLCRQRGLKRSGNVDKLRTRLEDDDVAVRDGTPRKNLSKYKTPADGSIRPRGVTGKRSGSNGEADGDVEPVGKKGRVRK